MSRRTKTRINLTKNSILRQLLTNDNEFKQGYNNTANLKDDNNLSEAEKQLIFKTLIPNITQALLQKKQNITLILETIIGPENKQANPSCANSTIEKLRGIPQESLTRILRDIISDLFIDAINNRVVL